MSRSMQPLLFLGYFPLPFFFHGKSESSQFEALQPVVQATKVDRLFSRCEVRWSKDVKAARPGLYAGQLIQIPEAETQDEIALVRGNILSQNNLAGVFVVGLFQPLGRSSG